MRAKTQYQGSSGLNILSRDQFEELHFATLEVLDRTGIKVHDSEALDLLKNGGARVDGNRVWIPAWMVQAAIATAPCTIPVADRNGERAMFLEKGRPYFGTGSDTPNTIDIYTSEHRQAVKQDVVNAARICDALENIDFVMSMAQYYNLPVFTTSGCSDAHVFDQQAGLEAGFSLLSATLSGANIIHDLGYIGIGMTSCMEMVALCDEAVGMAKYFLRGLEITPETLALDVMHEVGPGGNYIAQEHTFKHFKDQMYIPTLLNRQTYDQWQETGSTTFGQRANRKVRDILEFHEVPRLAKALENEVKAIAKKRDAGV